MTELNSIWRKILHLGQKKEVAKAFSLPIDKETLVFIDKGKVRLENITADGKQRVSLYLGSGCLVREMPLLSKTWHDASFLITVEASTLYYFPISLLKDTAFIQEYPDLIVNLIEGLAEKGMNFFNLVANTTEANPKIVICRYLLKLAEKHSTLVFSPHISQSELALALGLHRNTVVRVLKSLREGKIIGKFSRHKLEILNKKLLEEQC